MVQKKGRESLEVKELEEVTILRYYIPMKSLLISHDQKNVGIKNLFGGIMGSNQAAGAIIRHKKKGIVEITEPNMKAFRRNAKRLSAQIEKRMNDTTFHDIIKKLMED